MRHVISAAPNVDITLLVARVAGIATVDADPTPGIVRRYGYDTLYEMPAPLQKRARLEAIAAHADLLQGSAHAICDHSVFAFLADWMRWLWPETAPDEWERVLEQARPAVEKSETIHHVLSGPAVRADGYRWLDAGNARQVERLMRGLYRDFECEARVKEVSF